MKNIFSSLLFILVSYSFFIGCKKQENVSPARNEVQAKNVEGKVSNSIADENWVNQLIQNFGLQILDSQQI